METVTFFFLFFPAVLHDGKVPILRHGILYLGLVVYATSIDLDLMTGHICVLKGKYETYLAIALYIKKYKLVQD